MKSSFWQKLHWNPLFVGALLSYFVYLLVYKESTLFRIIGVVFFSFYFILAVTNWLSRGKIVQWAYSDDDEALKQDSEQDSEQGSDEDPEFDEEFHREKDEVLELVLGHEHDRVMHALIPFAVGGGLDLYFYPNYHAGTVVVTKELSQLHDAISNDSFERVEIAVSSRLQPGNLISDEDDSELRLINKLLNGMAHYVSERALNIGDTIEMPEGLEELSGKLFIVDEIPCGDLGGASFWSAAPHRNICPGISFRTAREWKRVIKPI